MRLQEIAINEKTFVTVSNYHNITYVHVREYDFYGKKKYPTKKGIALDLRRFKSLLLRMDEIREAVSKLIGGEKVNERIHLGDAIFVTVQSPYRCVQIRRYYSLDGKELPGRKGIVIRCGDEWANFSKGMNEVE